MIKALFFDLDDTLCNCSFAEKMAYKVALQYAMDSYSTMDLDVLQEFHQNYFLELPLTSFHLNKAAREEPKIWWKALFEQGIDDIVLAESLNNIFANTRLKNYELVTGVENMLKSLKQSYRLAIVTNGSFNTQWSKLKACGVNRFIENIIISEQCPEPKPHKSIFLMACQQVKCLPSEVIHIGDSLIADIQGGIEANLAATILVGSRKEKIALKEIEPDYEIPNILELQNLLNDIIREITDK